MHQKASFAQLRAKLFMLYQMIIKVHSKGCGEKFGWEFPEIPSHTRARVYLRKQKQSVA